MFKTLYALVSSTVLLTSLTSMASPMNELEKIQFSKGQKAVESLLGKVALPSGHHIAVCLKTMQYRPGYGARILCASSMKNFYEVNIVSDKDFAVRQGLGGVEIDLNIGLSLIYFATKKNKDNGTFCYNNKLGTISFKIARLTGMLEKACSEQKDDAIAGGGFFVDLTVGAKVQDYQAIEIKRKELPNQKKA